MSKILVTGASGFIGRHLVPKLREAGHEVIEVNSASGDVADKSTWLKFPQVEVVIHLAGKIFVPDSWVDPAMFIRTNLLGTFTALEYCRKHGARLIYPGSYLYGHAGAIPTPESAPLVANNPYGLSKRLVEEACQFYSDNFDNSDITILRIFNIYGPGQPENFLVPSIIRQVDIGKAIQVKDLEPKRDYVYIGDVAQAMLKAIYCQGRFNIFNIGTGSSHSVEELIRIIQAAKGTNLPVYSDAERRKSEIMDTVADITRAKLQLGWTPQWTLAQGVHQMVNELA